MTVTLKSPLKVEPFNETTQQNFNVFHTDLFLDKEKQDQENELNVTKVIRTQHLNTEEKEAILRI